MKRQKLLFVLLSVCFTLPLVAQNILFDDGFESGVFPDKGWTSITTPGATKTWKIDGSNNALAGSYSLYIDENATGGGLDPVKKEYAVTPEITLPADDIYGVDFLWVANSIFILDKPAYDFHVAVQADGETDWTTIWSASNKDNIEKSGVVFPWANWSRNSSSVSLAAYKGKKIKIAFIYDVWDPANGNMVRMDNVRVLPHTPLEGPILDGVNAYAFTDAYIGLKETSKIEELYIMNKGIGQLVVTAIEGLEGTDFTTNLVPGTFELGSQKTGHYNVYYTPTENGNRSAQMVIKSNGGDLTVNLSGTKVGLDPGYTVESFEGIDFYPAGWTGSGWELKKTARSGDNAIGNKLVNQATMISPLLDMATGSFKVVFDYTAIINEESDVYPEDELMLQLSKDGGASWNTIWTCPFSQENKPYQRVSIPINNPFSSECMIRFLYKLDGEISFDRELTSFYIDNIVLPPLAGRDNKPAAATNPTPADKAVDQHANNLLLKWRSVLLAEGYKLYVGDDQSNPTSVLNGVAVGKDKNSYIVNNLDYNKTYYWKVVPFNAAGSAENVPVWSFKTMADMSIRTLPYNENFEGDVFPPLGWTLDTDGFGNWGTVGFNPYEGKYSLSVFVTQNNTQASIQMPEVFLPADKEAQITFVWGNSVPAGLSKVKGENTEVTNEGGDSIYFEIKTQDKDWTMLAFCSQESPKWVKEKVLLSEYKGQRISLRWRYHATNIMKAKRAALDEVSLSIISEVGTPVITFKEWYEGRIHIRDKWDAGIVNYNKQTSSGEIFTLANEGEYDLKIQDVNFDTKFFSSTLDVGRVIAANKEINFAITLKGVEEQVEIKDTLRITFEDGQIAKFPVKGSAMGQYTYCYTFDDLEPFITTGINNLKTVDVDRYATFASSIKFPGAGSPYAFMVVDWTQIDWRNVYPRSGKNVLMAANHPFENQDHSEKISNDWLITEKLKPRAEAQLRFYAKSYAAAPDWMPHKLTVLVSTTNDDISSFKEVPSFTNVEIPCNLNDKKIFKECIVDLSEYVGKEIYVAIRHNSQKGMYMFIDDIYLENFTFNSGGDGEPVFVTKPIETANVGEEYSYSFKVEDPENDEITITVRSKASWMTYTPGTNGGTLSGIPDKADSYYVRIIATDGKHTVEQEFDVVVGTGSNVNNVHSSEITVYPNPATDVINIPEKYRGNVVLTDLTGKAVYQGENVTHINVEALQEGVYILKLDTELGNYSTKVVKK